MKARAFRYQRATTTAEALEAFRTAGGEAAYLAGGQSLISTMALRLQSPDVLIDIAHIDFAARRRRGGRQPAHRRADPPLRTDRQ